MGAIPSREGKMLSFTSLLVLCLVVSAVVYFVYKVIADSSRSVYRSREPLALVNPQDQPKKSTGSQFPVNQSAAFGQGGEHASPKNFARTFPAMPTESVDWRWEGSGVQLREPSLQPGNAAGKSGHCSLYDLNSPQPVTKPNPFAGRLHREETDRISGRSYKVTRKSQRTTKEDDRDLNKPWGW